MPPTLVNRVDLFPFIEDFYEAFLILYERKEDKSLPIRITEITAYSQLFPELNDNELLLAVVIEADNVHIEYLRKKAENENNEVGKT